MAAKHGGGMENPSAETASSSAGDPAAAPPSAVLAPSSVTHAATAGAAVVRPHKELAPSAVDTGKDTQCLVVEEDDSEC